MNIDQLGAHIGAIKEISGLVIPQAAGTVHLEIYYSVQHPAVAAVFSPPDAEGNREIVTPAIEARGEPFRYHLVNLPVDTANEIVAAIQSVLNGKLPK